jgi:hypothetical protein
MRVRSRHLADGKHNAAILGSADGSSEGMFFFEELMRVKLEKWMGESNKAVGSAVS